MTHQAGLPDAKAEQALLSGLDRREIVARLTPQMEAAELLVLQRQMTQVFTSPPLLDTRKPSCATPANHQDMYTAFHPAPVFHC